MIIQEMFSFFKSHKTNDLNIITDNNRNLVGKVNIITLSAGGDKLEVKVRYSPKARHLRIRITPKHIVELVLPKNTDTNKLKKAYEFVLEKESWIRHKLTNLIKSDQENKKLSNAGFVTKGIPNTILIFAKEHTVVLYNPNSLVDITVRDNKLLVSNRIAEVNIADRIALYLKQLVKRELLSYILVVSQRLQVRYNKVSVKDTKSRWGSCAHNGSLSFSWRLVFAPRYVMEYVVVHLTSALFIKSDHVSPH